MRTPRGSTLCSVLACLLLVAACSSDSAADSDGGGSTTTATTQAGSTDAMAFPGDGWAEGDPEELGFDAEELEIAAERADLADSNCFMVLRHGRVVYERYWNDTDASSAQEIFSATKSITSTLVGLAQSDGDLSVDDPASDYIEEWKGTDSADVTVENLLSNDSGREWSLALDYSGLVSAPDRTAFAVGLGQEYEPSTTWAYNNSAIQTLERVVSVSTGTDMGDYAAERLFGPLGMDDTEMTRDGTGHAAAFFGVHSTCPDMARFGHLFVNNGQWDGEEILPESWVEAATGHPSQELTSSYGYLFWLNYEGVLVDPTQALEPDDVQSSEVGQMAPGAPENLYAAIGLGGQIVLVDPGSETVVVRLGPAANRSPTSYGFAEAAEVVTTALVEQVNPTTTSTDRTDMVDTSTTSTTEIEVVEDFLDAMERLDIDGVLKLLAPDVVYQNVPLPPARGRDAVERQLRWFQSRAKGFDVKTHNIASNGPIVLTERTDAITIGPVRGAFWVCGTFEVHDGLITLWRDYFDPLDVAWSFVRGAGRALVGRTGAG